MKCCVQTKDSPSCASAAELSIDFYPASFFACIWMRRTSLQRGRPASGLQSLGVHSVLLDLRGAVAPLHSGHLQQLKLLGWVFLRSVQASENFQDGS